MDPLTGPTFGDLAEGGKAPSDDATKLRNRCRVKVSNVWLLDGRGPFPGEFLLRPQSADDARRIGVVASQYTGGVRWDSLPPATQGTVYAQAAVFVLGSGPGASLPKWYTDSPVGIIPPDLPEMVFARYQEWRAETFRDGEGAGPEASRRPVVDLDRPVGGTGGVPA